MLVWNLHSDPIRVPLPELNVEFVFPSGIIFALAQKHLTTMLRQFLWCFPFHGFEFQTAARLPALNCENIKEAEWKKPMSQSWISPWQSLSFPANRKMFPAVHPPWSCGPTDWCVWNIRQWSPVWKRCWRPWVVNSQSPKYVAMAYYVVVSWSAFDTLVS